MQVVEHSAATVSKSAVDKRIDRALETRHRFVSATRAVGATQLRQLLFQRTEDVGVLFAGGVDDFDVCAVHGAQRQCAVHHELHVRGTRSLLTGSGNLLGDVGGRDDVLCRGDVVILNESDLQATVHVRIVIDLVRDSVDELNDGLRANVAWGGLGTEDEHARWHVQRWVFLDAVVEIQDVERVEKLALVLVQTLNLGIEDGVRVHRNTLAVFQPGGEVLLVLVLDVENLTQHGLVVSKLFELSELVQVGDPGVRTRQASQQCRQARVALVEPAARGDSVGLVVEALRPDIVPVLQRFALNDFRVQSGNTVDGVRGVAGNPRHVDAAVGNRRHVVNLALVEAALREVFAEAAVDLTGDLQNAAEETVKNGVFPGLQRFCQNGVVGVGEGVGNDVPGVVPAHIVLIQE